ncbi:hypothetical protein ACKWTF_009035 [Chironomus riparius]
MASIDLDHSYYDVQRPRRTCTQKEPEQKEKSQNSDSESDIDTPDDLHDEDFSLNKPRKSKKKKKKVPKEPKDKKVNRIEIPSYDSVMQAQKALEDRLAGKNNAKYVYDSDSSELDELWTKVSDDEEPKEQIVKELPQPEPTKKKRLVIRPWNPQWYQIQH